jgi:hypothetical protein
MICARPIRCREVPHHRIFTWPVARATITSIRQVFWVLGSIPPPLAIILFPSNLSIRRGCKRRQREPRGWHQWLEGTSTSSIVLGSVTELASATVSGHTSTVDSLKLSSHRFQIGGICYQNLETQREQ